VTQNLSDCEHHSCRPHPRGSVRRASGFVLTSKPEVIGSSVGLVTRNGHIAINFRIVGSWETGTLSELVLSYYRCLAPQVDFDDPVHEVSVANEIQRGGKQRPLN
jgi:hypothetical protein